MAQGPIPIITGDGAKARGMTTDSILETLETNLRLMIANNGGVAPSTSPISELALIGIYKKINQIAADVAVMRGIAERAAAEDDAVDADVERLTAAAGKLS